MRKLLLTIFAIVAATIAAHAASISFDFLNNEYGMTRLSGNTNAYNPDPCEVTQTDCPVVIKFEGKTRLWSDGVRFYTGSKFTVSAPGNVIKSVTFGSNYAKFNYNSSALTAATWTSAAGEASAEFVCNITTKNTPVSTLTIEYEPAGNPDKDDAGIKYEVTSYTVEMGSEFTAPTLVNPNNLAITYTSSETDVATVAADGAVSVVGPGTTVITASSAETDKYNAGSANYTLTVLDVITDAAKIYTLAKGDKFILTEPVTVFYANGQYIYASGATRNLLLFGGTSYEVGTVITRLEGTIDIYNALYEITSYTAQTQDGGTPISPKTVSVSDITTDNINDYVLIDNADITGVNGKNATIEQDGNTVALYNRFGLTVEEATGVKIAAVVSIFGNNIQLQPTAIVDVTTGIDDIDADAAQSQYYNLQGLPVNSDAKGLLIRRQGNKTAKVIIK